MEALPKIVEKNQWHLLLILPLAVAAPLGSNRAWAWSFFEIVIYAMLAISLLFWATNKIQFKRRLTPHIYPLLLITLPFWLCSLVQYFLPEMPDHFSVGMSVLKGGMYIAYIVLLIFHCRGRERCNQLANALIIAGTVEALYALFLQLSGLSSSLVFHIPIGSRANGTFVYQNHLAFYLVMALCVGMCEFLRSLSHGSRRAGASFIARFLYATTGHKGFVRLSIIVMVIALILTKSRMANSVLFTIVLVALAVYMLNPKLEKKQRKGIAIFFISMIAIDTIALGSLVGLDKVGERLAQTGQIDTGRKNVVEDVLPHLSETPLYGHGGGSFYTIYPSMEQEYSSAYYDFAHNEYLEFYLEYGPIAMALSALGWLWLLTKSYSKTINGQREFYPMLLFTGVGILVMISVDFHMQAPGTVIMALSALFYMLTRAGRGRVRRRSRSSRHSI